MLLGFLSPRDPLIMDHVLILLLQSSLDEKKAQLVVEEIKAAGGDAIAVGGDVGADDFPQRILDATIKYVVSTSSPILVSLPYFHPTLLAFAYRANECTMML